MDKNLINEYDYYNLKDAKNKFNEIFKERTNNIWDVAKLDKFNFKADNPDYYYYFGYDYSQELKIYEYLKTKINNNSQIKMKIQYNENDNIKNLIYFLVRKAFMINYIIMIIILKVKCLKNIKIKVLKKQYIY